MAAKDYYQVLGVQRSASDKEIKAAYRKLARKHHPDVNPNDKSAEKRFQEINQAYQVLSDKDTRSKYDQFGADFEKMGTPPPGYGPAGGYGPGPGYRQRAGSANYQVNFEDLGDLIGGRTGNGGAGSFGDLLGDLFGGGGGRVRGGPGGGFSSRQQPDSEFRVDVPLEEAFHGGQRTIEVAVQEACPTCHGTGLSGKGPCPKCHGRGSLDALQRIDVTIPAGVTDETGLRVQAGGREIILRVHLLPHDTYEVKGADLHMEVPITVVEAALGGEITFPTLKGTATMRVPAGTPSGRVFRLGGQGLPAFGSRPAGNLYVKTRIVVPSPMTPEHTRLFEELAKLPQENPRLNLGRRS